MFCFLLSASYPMLKDYKLNFWRLGGGFEFYHCSDTGKMASLFVDVVDSPYLNEFVLSCMMRNGELFFYYLESLTILNVSASIILYHLWWQYLYVALNVKRWDASVLARVFNVLSLILKEPSPLPAYSVGLVSQTSLMQSWQDLPLCSWCKFKLLQQTAVKQVVQELA